MYFRLLESSKLWESAGCEVHYASADGDRLIVLTTLGVADYDGASVLIGYGKTSL